MSKLYRIHFGFSKTKRYPQALELSRLAHQHDLRGDSNSLWHIVSFTNEQIDLMASLYKIASKLPPPRIYGVDIYSLVVYCKKDGNHDYFYDSKAHKDRQLLAVQRLCEETGKTFQELFDFLKDHYLKPFHDDMARVNEKLTKEGYLDSHDYDNHKSTKAYKKPKEHVEDYRVIRNLISKGSYVEAVNKYYQCLGEKFYGELHGELIYLKRLAGINLSGRDLLYFRSESSRNEIISSNLLDYCDCIDDVLEQYKNAGLKLPLDIILENAPTMDELVEKTEKELHSGVCLWGGVFEQDLTPITADFFGAKYGSCPDGRLFDKYPDQIQCCKIIEKAEDPKYTGFWTTYPLGYHKRDILDKGFYVSGIDVCRHKNWRGRRRNPDFTILNSTSNIIRDRYGTDGIRYTGRNHIIGNEVFYEIDLVRFKDKPVMELNPFTDLVDEVLREAENILREKHGLPRIGEGWISEMRLYNLVKSNFSEALHHASPEWLKPQHLDIFVPSKKIAFEYQGRQHFEKVDFFGGVEALKNIRKLDKRKMLKCKSNKVLLIYWRYDEPIEQDVLSDKLKDFFKN